MLLGLGLFGSALLYGDGVITPAVSVLGAVEGLGTATPALRGLHRAAVGADPGGPVPRPAAGHRPGRRDVRAGDGALVHHDWRRRVLVDRDEPARAQRDQPDPRGDASSSRTATTRSSCWARCSWWSPAGRRFTPTWGTSARSRSASAWFAIVMPGLLLNYFGQGALLLSNPAAVDSPFFHLVQPSMILPLALLATVAAVIASQALISAVFSLTRQAVQLGYSPRVEIRHTSASTIGQIYVPVINLTLAIATIALVIGFRSSSALAAAYGIAVTGDDGHHDDPGVRRVAAGLQVEPVRGGALIAGLPDRRPGVLRRQRAEDPARRMGAARDRRGGLHAALDLEDGAAMLGARLRERAYPFELFLKDLTRARPIACRGRRSS